MEEISKENKEKSSQDTNANNIAEENRIIDEMMHSTNYISWLIKYTKDKESFSNEKLLNYPEETFDSDEENIKSLGLFFEGIRSYALQNRICYTISDFNVYYNIKIMECGFQIGWKTDLGDVYFCNKVPVEKDKNFINFRDIMLDKKQEKLDYINNPLENLSSMIENVYNNGFSIEEIEETYNNTINNIRSKNIKMKTRNKSNS
ncbi:MAG: hypothetical protein VZS44_00635 [Bacilli bacterium]|nr:hypothetical protein [Bacilli bacterium]